ncbi:hypothetical protein ACFX13_033970 [Malus domestica]
MAWDRGVSASRRGRGRRGQVAEGGRCLYVEGNLVDVLVHQDRTAATSDENMVDESGLLRTRRTGMTTRGGGGWPEAAARSP